jgi:3-hydroxybutyryl-CoA dehydrogenase
LNIDEISHVLIIGAGTMGQQIGFQCAISGYDVTLYDVESRYLDNAMKRIVLLSDSFKKHGRLTSEAAQAALERIRCTSDPADAARNADFVSESVPEDPELKARVFAQFDKLCPSHTIFTTNTSTLMPSMFAQATGRPDRFAAFHFHDIQVTQVVDIMPHPGTSPETVAIVQAFAERIGQIAILLQKENIGYVFNAMLTELLRAAQALAANAVASVEDIDRAWIGIMRTPSGPFGIMDSIGLDTVWKVTDYWARKRQDPQALTNAAFMKRYIDAGRLGMKTGQGFYRYPEPAFLKPGFLEGRIAPELSAEINLKAS